MNKHSELPLRAKYQEFRVSAQIPPEVVKQLSRNVLVTVLAVIFTQFIFCVIFAVIVLLHHARMIDWFPALTELTGEGYLREIKRGELNINIDKLEKEYSLIPGHISSNKRNVKSCWTIAEKGIELHLPQKSHNLPNMLSRSKVRVEHQPKSSE
ncbi:unnamed protein product [Haemonchus placei]|uniref:PHM7_ext domain-containing protein n=1 Tax=Haemonchus placei TaxID=6290 RepID=A0A0N4X616_HAEPC|nr:unnamed protein product [Haemonchus placei]